MALPTLVKTWQFNVNNAQASLGSASTDCKTLLLALKNALVGFGTLPWTVKYSCNSVTAGTAGDGVDRWSTIANIVNVNSGAHSWFILGQSGVNSGYQLKLDLLTSSVNVVSTLSQSSSAGFTGGTTSVAPTATDEQVLGTNWAFSSNTDVAYRWSVMQSTDGQCTRIFVISAGALISNLIIDKFANATGGTPGGTNSGWGSINTLLTGFTRQNGVNTSTVVSYESAANQAIASEVDGVFDIFPAAAVGSAVGARGRLGTFQDIWFGSSGVAFGDVYPATGSPAAQFVQLTNGLILPWNNGPVNLT